MTIVCWSRGFRETDMVGKRRERAAWYRARAGRFALGRGFHARPGRRVRRPYLLGVSSGSRVAHTLTITPGARVGLAVFAGHVTGDEMAQACRSLVTDPEWEPGFDEVWDLRGASEVDVDPGELKRLVAGAHDLRDKFVDNRVVFVTRREVIDVLTHLFGLLTADLDRTYRRVDTPEAAAAWLGVPPSACGG